MKKAAPQYQQSSPSHGQNSTGHGELLEEAPSKIARVLAYLLPACNSLNRFEAEALGDHCLNSTIAKLAHRYGLAFRRQPEKVPNRWGKSCDVTRYSLKGSECERARAVLAQLNAKEGKPL